MRPLEIGHGRKEQYRAGEDLANIVSTDRAPELCYSHSRPAHKTDSILDYVEACGFSRRDHSPQAQIWHRVTSSDLKQNLAGRSFDTNEELFHVSRLFRLAFPMTYLYPLFWPG
jgi:hypothetical protein